MYCMRYGPLYSVVNQPGTRKHRRVTLIPRAVGSRTEALLLSASVSSPFSMLQFNPK